MDLGGGVEFGTRNWQFPTPGHGLHDNVSFLDAAGQERLFRSGEERLDYGGVPARVDDSDAEAAAVVFLGFAGSFEGGVHFWGWDAWFG